MTAAAVAISPVDLPAGGWNDEIYHKVRHLARGLLRFERCDHTLQATALAHEAFLRMARMDRMHVHSPEHVCSLAVLTMRRILVDHARSRANTKRGGQWCRVPLIDEIDPGLDPAIELLALDQAIETLASIDATAARVVELRCFGGFTVAEVASLLSTSESTVARLWRMSRAWLHRQLRGE